MHGRSKHHGTFSSGGVSFGNVNIEVGRLSPADKTFFCKYNTDVDAERARLQRELRSRSGGPLGIESVLELVIASQDIAAAQRDWRVLLGPPRAGEESVWQVGSGPAIRLVADRQATWRCSA